MSRYAWGWGRVKDEGSVSASVHVCGGGEDGKEEAGSWEMSARQQETGLGQALGHKGLQGWAPKTPPWEREGARRCVWEGVEAMPAPPSPPSGRRKQAAVPGGVPGGEHSEEGRP